jgi:AraC-like DNA-binding protein
MIFLTKSMVNPDFQRLQSLARSVPEPTDYYRGVCPNGREAPRNVLLFARLESALLYSQEHFAFQHSRFVLITCIASSGSVAVDGHWHRLLAGQALLVFPYEVHAFAEMEGSPMCWLFLTFELTEKTHLERLRRKVARLSPRGLGWLRQVLEFWQKNQTDRRSVALLTGLILDDLRSQLPRGGRKRVSPASEPAPQLLSRIHAIAEQENPACRIKDLALRLGISEPHLRAQFRELTNESLGTYLRKLRMTRAAALLSSSSLSVGEIAGRCGFDSLYSFSRGFHHAFGLPPTAYRHQHTRR